MSWNRIMFAVGVPSGAEAGSFRATIRLRMGKSGIAHLAIPARNAAAHHSVEKGIDISEGIPANDTHASISSPFRSGLITSSAGAVAGWGVAELPRRGAGLTRVAEATSGSGARR